MTVTGSKDLTGGTKVLEVDEIHTFYGSIEALKPPKRQRPVIAVIGINDATEITDYVLPTGILRRAARHAQHGVPSAVGAQPQEGASNGQ